VWIYDEENSALLNVTLANGSLQIIRTVNIYIDNMALLPTADLLLSSRKKLLTLSHTTWKTEDFKCKQSLKEITEALHVTKDDKIIVGCVNNNTRQPEVLVMDMTVHNETVYCHDTNTLSPFSWMKNTSMFAGPIRVTSDSCHYVYVMVRIPFENNWMVILGQDGEVRSIYSGCDDYSFEPVDLVATELDNVIVLDGQSCLHVINSEGKCIKCQRLSDLGVKEAARSLDIDNNGMLLIGCKSQNNDANILVVKFSGIRSIFKLAS
jgi:hypothetical protein